jgi:signal peptidase I
MTEQRRGLPARIGVTLLNVLAPGVGLLRVGQLRRGLILYGFSVATLPTFIMVLALTQNISFVAYVAAIGIVVLTTLAVLIVAIWSTWRASGILPLRRPLWSHWGFIVGAILLSIAIDAPFTDLRKTSYRSFYMPSESMEPTLYTNDKFVASMLPPRDLHRGDILLVKTDTGAIYVKRLAALSGDRIAMKDGIVFINGAAVELMPQGARRVSYPYKEVTEARLYRETLPGEVGSHLIEDLGATPQDDVTEITIPPGHLFLLGDNRDDSADSRVSKMEGGLELVPVDRIVGRPLFFYWPIARMGERIAEVAK